MPMYIKIDARDTGKVYAWVSDSPSWNGQNSIAAALSVPKLLRLLAAKIEKEAK